MIKSETINKIAAALVQAQAEMGNATKGATNPFFKSSYADLNAIREAVLPPLNKHGISALQPTVVVDGKNYVETMLLHTSGEFISSLTEIKVGKVNDPQAEGSGISYARRYGLQSFVNMGAKDDDGEAATARVPTAASGKLASDITATPVKTASSFARKAVTPTVTVPTVSATVAASTAISNGVAKTTVGTSNGTTVDGWES